MKTLMLKKKKRMSYLIYIMDIWSAVLPFEATAFEKGIDFSYDINPEIKVMGDKIALEKMVSIFADNAINHCKAGGSVTISLARESGKIVLATSNTGDEIPKNEREKLFERFYKIDDAHTENYGHYGLGLAIAKATADAHKAKIYVECKNGEVRFIVIF